MKYELKTNGSVALILKPETNLEREFFNELFSGEAVISQLVSPAHQGEVLITTKKSNLDKDAS